MTTFQIILTIDCPRLLRCEIAKLKDIFNSKQLGKYNIKIDSITVEEPPSWSEDSTPEPSSKTDVLLDEWSL